MLGQPIGLRRWLKVVPLAAVASMAFPLAAAAHIKWFAPYCVPCQPQPLTQVFNPSFISLFVSGAIFLWLVCHVERMALGSAVLRGIERVTAPMRPRTEDMYRACTAAFFVCLFTLHDIILTPELRTGLGAIPWLQAGMAIGMFWRPTMVLSAAGIVALYAYGVFTYGIFHLLDYPIFLSIAVYLGLTGAGIRKVFGFAPLDWARWGAGVTLIWASVEKWAYPQWTSPVLQAHPSLCMGLNSHFYMIAAGFVEFSLGFAMLWTPLVRRLAAIVLSAMFISAIFSFGMVDAVGHLMIICCLFGIAADDQPIVRRPPILAPALYTASLAAILTTYYGLHALIYGTVIW